MNPAQRHCARRPHEPLGTDSRHGVQAYHGGGGHIHDDGERVFYARQTMNLAAETRRLIEASGLPGPIVPVPARVRFELGSIWWV
jgi:hypothetical protein